MGRSFFKNLTKLTANLSNSHMTSKFFFSIFNISMKCFATYPLFDTSNQIVLKLYRLLWWFYVFNCSTLIIPTLHTMFTNFNDVTTSAYSVMELSGILECLVILIHFRIQEKRIKVNYY